MKTEEVLHLIHQNGTGQDIECVLGSKSNGNLIDFHSKIHNYKINKNSLKVFLDKFNYEKHKDNLSKNSLCEIVIKKIGKYSCEIFLYCIFVKAEFNVIHMRVFNVSYLDDDGQKIKTKYESF